MSEAPEYKREEFGASGSRALVETAASAVAAQAEASVKARYVMALQRPRDWDVVRDRLLKECRRPGFAEVAIYRKPIGEGITGPSIRFAEAALRCMGNVLPEVSTVYDDAQKRIVRVSVTDLESNLTYSKDVVIQKTVERNRLQDGQAPISSRRNSKGMTVYIVEATDDDILNKENALISKAIRTSGLRLIPGDIMDECRAAIEDTKRKKITDDPDSYRKKLLDSFSSIGVSPAQLKMYSKQELDTLSPDQLEELRDLFNAIRDGETNWREVMDAVSGSESLTEEEEAKAKAKQDALRAKLAVTRERRMQKNAQSSPQLPGDDKVQPLVKEAIRKRGAMFANQEAAHAEIRKAVYQEFGDLSAISGGAIARAVTFAQNFTPDAAIAGALKGAK